MCVCVIKNGCVCERERDSVSVCVCGIERERETERDREKGGSYFIDLYNSFAPRLIDPVFFGLAPRA